MSERTMTPSVASSGGSWVNASNALTENGAYATFPANTVSATDLRLTNLSNRTIPLNHTIAGVAVTVKAVGTNPGGLSGATFGMYVNQAGPTVPATLAEATDSAPETYDGSPTTYVGSTGLSTTPFSGTVIHDLGSVVPVGRLVANWGHWSSVFGYSFSWSIDGVTWNSFTTDGGHMSDPSGTDDEMAGRYSNSMYVETVNARYVRLFAYDVHVSGGDHVLGRIYEFTVYAANGTTAYFHDGSATNRLQVSLTANGTDPIGTPQTINVGGQGGSCTVGGLGQFLGASLTPEDLNASTFGILIRRGDALGGETTSTDRRIDIAWLTVWHTTSEGSFVMSERLEAVQLCIIGKEATPGTAENPSIRLKAAKLEFQPQVETQEDRDQGDLLPSAYPIVAESSEGSLNGRPTYDEIGYLLASIIGKPVTDTVAVGVYRHTFNLNTRAPGNYQTYTHEYGDPSFAERVTFAILSEFGITMDRKNAAITGKAIARKIADQSGLTAGASSVQSLAMGTATSFKLRFKGDETASLTVAGLNAAAIQTALQGLSTVGSGNMTVSGTGPYVITGAGTLAGQSLPLIEVSAFAGGTTPTTAITTLGGYTELPCIRILPGSLSLYYAASRATLAANKLTMLFDSSFLIGNRVAEYWVMDDAQGSWGGVGDTPMNMSMKLTVQADAIAAGMATDARNQSQRYLRLESIGPEITAGNPHKLTIDLSCKVKLLGNFKMAGNVIRAREFEVGATFDPAWGQAATFVLINGVSGY